MLFVGILIGVLLTPVIVIIGGDLAIWYAERKASRDDERPPRFVEWPHPGEDGPAATPTHPPTLKLVWPEPGEREG